MPFQRSMHSLAAFVAAISLAGPAHLALAADMPPVGAAAPNFTLPSQDNSPVSLNDYKGKWVVLYFYPKDQTTGCSIEAHNFQRDLSKYQALNAVVLGVSMDTVDSHRQWCTKDSFTFKMLADPNHKAIDAYGVPVKQVNIGGQPTSIALRDTFLISPEGKIVKMWEVKDVNGHSAEVLAALQSLK